MSPFDKFIENVSQKLQIEAIDQDKNVTNGTYLSFLSYMYGVVIARRILLEEWDKFNMEVIEQTGEQNEDNS